jgi:uncharacterized protein
LDLSTLFLLAGAALAASTIAAITGTGGGILLLPVMTLVFGVRDAIPMYAVAQLIGNLSRVGLNLAQILLDIVAWFTVGAIPMAVVGALAFARTSEAGLVRLLGAFLLVSVLLRHWGRDRVPELPVAWFAPVGGVFAFVSALLGSAGPFMAQFFLAFGLFKGAYIGTEALATGLMHVVKLSTYQATGTLSATALIAGVALGPLMVLGSWVGRGLLARVPERAFAGVVDTIVIGFGLLFLMRG